MFFRKPEDAILAAVNLAGSLSLSSRRGFVLTFDGDARAFAGYVDALYFTVATLYKKTGFGDITLTTTGTASCVGFNFGWVGVALFVQLARTILPARQGETTPVRNAG